MRKFALGDVHGRIEALKEVLKASSFDYNNDKLIVLGDIVDGGYNTYEVVEELLKIKNIVFVLGNHDEMFLNGIRSGWPQKIWINQGGANTINSYGGRANPGNTLNEDFQVDLKGVNIPITHQLFFNKAVYYHIEDNNRLFVHGGIDPHYPIIQQEKHTLLWDRTLPERFLNNVKTDFQDIYIGHTSTQSIMNNVEYIKPILLKTSTTSLHCLDTGAGWDGCLTILNIDDGHYWQSIRQVPATGRPPPINLCSCGRKLNTNGEYSKKCRDCQRIQDNEYNHKVALEQLARKVCKECKKPLPVKRVIYCDSCREKRNYGFQKTTSELRKLREEKLKVMSPQELLELVRRGGFDGI